MTLNAVKHNALDFHGLNQLRNQAAQTSVEDKDQQQVLREVAGQFEALFISMMLKSMREASLADGIFDSSQSKMYREMADQQMAMDMASRGGLGLQDVIMRQLGGNEKPSALEDTPAAKGFSMDTVSIRSSLMPHAEQRILEQVRQAKPDKLTPRDELEIDNIRAMQAGNPMVFDSPASFVRQLWPMAEQAAEKIGVSPEVIIAQAALETGWGKHVLQNSDGSSSHNLFNIKAGRSWTGNTTQLNALEFHDGKAVRELSQFRSYGSFQQSFDDYVEFLQTQPRYQTALRYSHNPERFIEELHRAGYATDPNYADKIKRIMQGATVAQNSHGSAYS